MTKTDTAARAAMKPKTYAQITDGHDVFHLYSRDAQGNTYHFEYSKGDMDEMFTVEEQRQLERGEVVVQTSRDGIRLRAPLRYISGDALAVLSAL